MFKIIIMIIIGIAGGVIGGMGMGGGTLLIPLLTMFTNFDQHLAQSINLIAFIPMSLAALFFHFKNKLVRIRYALWISVPAVFSGVLFAYLAKRVTAKSLSIYFGIFLIVLGIYQLITIVIALFKNKQNAVKEKN